MANIAWICSQVFKSEVPNHNQVNEEARAQGMYLLGVYIAEQGYVGVL